MRARVFAGTLALIALGVRPADAKPVARVAGGSVLFYNGSLELAVRNHVTMRLANGILVTGDAAFVDLRAGRVIPSLSRDSHHHHI